MRNWEDLGFHVPKIILPAEEVDYSRWATVACDQFTSQPEYWEEAERIAGESPSALRLVLPEYYLGKPDEEDRIARVHRTMEEYLENGVLRELPEGAVAVIRESCGHIRRGLVMALDLEAYDYSRDSKSLIRATEATIPERIPPRLKIRRGAAAEFPHILVLLDDPGKTVVEPLTDENGGASFEKLYDAELMLGGGHIRGYFVPAERLSGAKEAVEVLMEKAAEKYGKGKELLIAMGDGNHSLATAKAYWEEIKRSLVPEKREGHPARYALCEVENLHDPGIVMEPIHRLLFGEGRMTGQEMLDHIAEILNEQNGGCYLRPNGGDAAESGDFVFPYFTGKESGEIVVTGPAKVLPVAVLQTAIDTFLADSGLKIDFIHGDAALEKLASERNNLGFLLPAIDKFRLFDSVAKDGPLPRKTFSMGEAEEKRYYIEGRKIR
ncbi:MAG: DUF1015 domain-containing protein [Lachnospiraceae bacterium]|nr:DUF1015 domain-containing protein [Lachnospiraceae bacterium]